MDTKRILPIVFGILGLIVVAVIVYLLFFRTSTPGIQVGTGENPFGEGGDFTGNSGNPDVSDGATGTEVAPNLVKITSGPVALGTAIVPVLKVVDSDVSIGSTTGTAPVPVTVPEVKYVERESGNIFSYDTSSRTSTRISNRTLPGIQEAVWTPDGRTVFMRYLSENGGGNERIDTYVLEVDKEDGGFFLETNLDQVVITGTSSVITLLPSTTGSIATSARTDGSNVKTFFSSNLSSLRLYTAGKGLIALTKPARQLDGFGFMVSATGSFERVLGPLKGLTLLPSPSGKSIAYSYVSGNSIVAGVLDVATRTATTLPVAILPEKCVWTSDETALYCGVPRTISVGWPDAWYQGTTLFSDRIWKIDMAARNAVLVVDPTSVAGTDIDAVSLSIDTKSDYLIFTNKRDGSLWAYDL